jgi:predicted amidophosphoribosyltransferase
MSERSGFHSLINLLAPVACAGCQRPDVDLCARCKKILPGRILHAEPVVAQALYDVPVYSAGLYRGVRRSLVMSVKEGSKRTLVPYLFHRSLLDTVAEVLSRHPGAILVPIPSSPLGALRRGYWPTLVISKHLRRRVPGVRIIEALHFAWFKNPVPHFFRLRFGGAKRRMSRSDRLIRNASEFRVSRLPTPTTVMLLDDVMTTGGTLEAAATAVHQAGHQVVACLVMAHVPSQRKPISAFSEADYAGVTTLTRRT